MFFKFLSFILLTALWWAALWLALPVEWLQGSLASLAGLHAGPPALVAATWWAGKRAWNWRKNRAEKRAKAAETAKTEANLAAEKAAHEEKQSKRRAYLHCRAVWAELTNAPTWVEACTDQCVLFEQLPQNIQGKGSSAVLTASLEQVFEAAFQQCHATAWLPVMLVSKDPTQLALVGQAWRSALARGIAHPTQFRGTLFESDHTALFSHLIAQFEADPTLPAIIVVGMCSPLADADSPTVPLGHAVVGILLSHPNLVDPGEPETEIDDDQTDDTLRPFWEKSQPHEANPAQWDRIPPLLRQDLWNLYPFASLHRPSTATVLEFKRNSTKAQKIQGAIQAAFDDAGLRNLPFEEGVAPGSAPELPDPFGWIVHNVASNRTDVLASAIRDCGSEIDVISDACDLKQEHGGVGTAESVLALAEASILAMQLQKPVLTALCNEKDSFSVSFACPVIATGTSDAEPTIASPNE